MVIGDRINYNFLNFAGGDRNFTQQQIFSNDLMCFRRRSHNQPSSQVCRGDRNLTQQQILSNDLIYF
jgi:hypothetical protein